MCQYFYQSVWTCIKVLSEHILCTEDYYFALSFVCKESREMILCSGIDMKCVCVCMRERERARKSRDTRCIDTENTQVECILTKEKDSTYYKVGGGCFI